MAIQQSHTRFSFIAVLVALALLFGATGCGSSSLGPASLDDPSNDPNYASAFAAHFTAGSSPVYVVTKVASAGDLNPLAQVPKAFHIGIYDPGSGAVQVAIAYTVGPVGSGDPVENSSISQGGFETTKTLTVTPTSTDAKQRADAVMQEIVSTLSSIKG